MSIGLMLIMQTPIGTGILVQSHMSLTKFLMADPRHDEDWTQHFHVSSSNLYIQMERQKWKSKWMKWRMELIGNRWCM